MLPLAASALFCVCLMMIKWSAKGEIEITKFSIFTLLFSHRKFNLGILERHFLFIIEALLKPKWWSAVFRVERRVLVFSVKICVCCAIKTFLCICMGPGSPSWEKFKCREWVKNHLNYIGEKMSIFERPWRLELKRDRRKNYVTFPSPRRNQPSRH